MIYSLYQYNSHTGKCECGGGCCEQYKFYSYNDSVPVGGDYTVCPNYDQTCQKLPPVSCCGAVLNGYIYSDDFSQKCFSNGKPKMTLYAGSVIDDYGSIGTASAKGNCPASAIFTEDATMDAEVYQQKLRVPITIYNGPDICGPYGLTAVSVKWFFQK